MATTDADKYEVLDKIGHGSFGIIRKVRRKTDKKILCRKEIAYIRMSQKEREQLHAEFSILASLHHPNIVGYYHRDHLKPTQELHLYMEYCGGGDLSKKIKTLKANNQSAEEGYVWSIVAQLLTALYRCHYGEDPAEVGNNIMAPAKPKDSGLRPKNQTMILHRDLKPENIFLGEGDEVKLGDFGLSKLMQSHDFASTYVGTPFYMSPEICAAEKYTLHSDIWSLGCIIYELCAKEPPFNAKTHYHLVQKIKEGRVAPLPKIYSPDLNALVKSCLNVNPSRRPDTAMLLELPMIRLMRKEKQVVEVGKVMRAREAEAIEKTKEAQALLASFEADKKLARVELESTVRREWEVKARLEIDRQVALERDKMQKAYEMEVQARVKVEVEEKLKALQKETAGTSSPTTTPVPGLSTISAATSFDDPLSDLSSLSLDTPGTAASVAPVSMKRSSRTPFSRARTQIDSPMDVHMASPSPMSIASLSLSPRRAAALGQGISENIFAAGGAGGAASNRRDRWQPQLMSPMTSEDEAENEDDEADHVPELPSPTRMPRATAIQDRFKAPRPSMKRQNTLPANRLTAQPPLFGAAGTAASAVPARAKSPASPARRLPRPLSKAVTTIGISGDDMFKAVVARNMNNANTANAAPTSTGTTVGGRTLIELQQARAGLEPGEGGIKIAGRLMDFERQKEVAEWNADVEGDEMPSPFKKPIAAHR